MGAETPNNNCKIINDVSEFKATFGYDVIEVSDDDITALLQGKLLLSTVGEYAAVIKKEEQKCND